jgi:hypothetical protein
MDVVFGTRNCGGAWAFLAQREQNNTAVVTMRLAELLTQAGVQVVELPDPIEEARMINGHLTV